jgi:hypothetical protein
MSFQNPAIQKYIPKNEAKARTKDGLWIEKKTIIENENQLID